MMTTSSFPLSISYGQICIFDSLLADPFNEWTDQHFEQGFSWRSGSVSFATVNESGPHAVIVSESDIDEPLSSALRIIEVPFEVPASGQIEVASIAQSVPLGVAPGVYQLRFQSMSPDRGGHPVIKLDFHRTATPVFRVLRLDAGWKDAHELLLDARPA